MGSKLMGSQVARVPGTTSTTCSLDMCRLLTWKKERTEGKYQT